MGLSRPASDRRGSEALVFDIRPAHPDGQYPILLVNYVTVGWDETIPVAHRFRELVLLAKSLFHVIERRLSMPDNQSSNGHSSADLTRLDAGTPVYDIDGQRVGTLNVAKTGDYLVVTALDGRELYLPLSVVNQSGPDGIHLGLSSRDLAGDEWDAPRNPE